MGVWGAAWWVTWMITLAMFFMGLAVLIVSFVMLDKQKKKALRLSQQRRRANKRNI